MPRPISRIEVYLPLADNDGSPIEDVKFDSIEDELVDRFGGVTVTQRQFPLKGLWHSGERVFQDQVIVFTVMDFHTETRIEVLRYLGRLKSRLKRKFDQLDVLITVQDLLAI